jgi:hypothetical protein
MLSNFNPMPSKIKEDSIYNKNKSYICRNLNRMVGVEFLSPTETLESCAFNQVLNNPCVCFGGSSRHPKVLLLLVCLSLIIMIEFSESIIFTFPLHFGRHLCRFRNTLLADIINKLYKLYKYKYIYTHGLPRIV